MPAPGFRYVEISGKKYLAYVAPQYLEIFFDAGDLLGAPAVATIDGVERQLADVKLSATWLRATPGAAFGGVIPPGDFGRIGETVSSSPVTPAMIAPASLEPEIPTETLINEGSANGGE